MTHVVDNRIVLTYEPDGWPAGVITGYAQRETFCVEHVIVFPWAPGKTMMAMLRVGLEEARRRGYTRVMFILPDAFPLTPKLRRVGERLGFRLVIKGADREYFERSVA